MEEETKRKGCGRVVDWIKTPAAAIYINYLLSSWGDRMWGFAVGLYLVFFEDGVLLLAAAFIFSSSVAILLLGGVIGNWVDHNPRLKVVRISLFIQNLTVALCALCVCVFLHYNAHVQGTERHLLEAAIISLAVVARLASTAYKIAMEKDWIVVVSEGNSSVLANLNAVTRSLDLLSKVLAPLCLGVILGLISLMAGALFIAGWNVLSVLVEYALLMRVYRLVPRLAYKEGVNDPKEKPEQEMNELNVKSLMEEAEQREDADTKNSQKDGNQNLKEEDDEYEAERKREKTCARTMFDPFITLVRGWHVYARQPIVFSGVALACLYMTVLGVDSITVGYLYSQDLSELALGLAVAACGLTGITATFLFTRLRKCMGLERTGILAFTLEISCLVLAVASIWAPGSPFDPGYFRRGSDVQESPNPDCHTSANSTLCNIQAPKIAQDLNSTTLESNVTETAYSVIDNMKVNKTLNDTDETESPKTSAALFLTGIITSRIGLWMADLTATQLMQEHVIEKERGIVNGVQHSMNMLFYMLMQCMIFFLPRIETFGFLILASFAAICLAGCFFLVHVCRVNRTRAHQGRACCSCLCYHGDMSDQATSLATSKA